MGRKRSDGPSGSGHGGGTGVPGAPGTGAGNGYGVLREPASLQRAVSAHRGEEGAVIRRFALAALLLLILAPFAVMTLTAPLPRSGPTS